MEIQELLRYLALAELHVADGQRQIAQQRMLIEQMETEGKDTAACRKLLEFLVVTQADQRADRDKIIEDVVKLRLRSQ